MPRTPKPWFRRSTGWWMVQIAGRQHKLAEGKTNRPAAMRKFAKLLTSHYSRPAADDPDADVSSIVDEYLASIQQTAGKRTYEQRYAYLLRFAEHLGRRPVDECKPFHVERWLSLNPKWNTWARNDAVKSVMAAFNWAARQRLIPSNPFRGVQRPKGERRRAMTASEWQSILRASGGGYGGKKGRPTAAARFRQVLVFLRYSGARPHEVSGLRWEHVDAARGLVIQHEHKTRTTQRTPRPRIIPLHPVCVKLLAWIRRHDDKAGGWVFVNYRGKPWTRRTLGQRLVKAREKAGVEKGATLYGIRHHFGTAAIMNGVDLKTLAELMGHTTTKHTEQYVHLAEQHQYLAGAMRQAVGRLAEREKPSSRDDASSASEHRRKK